MKPGRSIDSTGSFGLYATRTCAPIGNSSRTLCQARVFVPISVELYRVPV